MNLLKKAFLINVYSYTGSCNYSQYRQLFWDLFAFFIPSILVPISSIVVDGTKSDIKEDKLATLDDKSITGAGNRTDTSLSLKKMSEMIDWLLWIID